MAWWVIGCVAGGAAGPGPRARDPGRRGAGGAHRRRGGDDAGRVLFRHRARGVRAGEQHEGADRCGRAAGARRPPRSRRRSRCARGGSWSPPAATRTGSPAAAHAPEVVFAEVAACLQRLGVVAVRGIDLEAGTFVGPAGRRPGRRTSCRPTTARRPVRSCSTRAPSRWRSPPAGRHGGGGDRRPRVATWCATAIEWSRPPRTPLRRHRPGHAVQVRGRFYRSSPPVTIRTAVGGSRDLV
jgi:hypothetical protein